MRTAQNEIGEAEELASAFISGRNSSDDCPHLSQLVEEVKEGSLSKDDFIDILDFHLQENKKMEELNKVV